MAGKPSFLDLLPPISMREGGPGGADDICYRERLRAVLATDDMIDGLVKALTSLDLLESTYMFYTADNGYHQGEHRLTPGKCGTFSLFLPLSPRTFAEEACCVQSRLSRMCTSPTGSAAPASSQARSPTSRAFPSPGTAFLLRTCVFCCFSSHPR